MNIRHRLLLLSLPLAATAWLSAISSRHTAAPAIVHAQSGPSCFDTGRACVTLPDGTQPDLERFGADLMTQLMGSGAVGQPGYLPAAWEAGGSTWQSKCTVLGQQSLCPPAGARSANGKVASSIAPALQLTGSGGAPSASDANPQLASVLYNSIAAKAIAQSRSSYPQQGYMQKLPAGSIIVKPVWQIFPAAAQFKLYASTMTAAKERTLRRSMLNASIASDAYDFPPVTGSMTSTAGSQTCVPRSNGRVGKASAQCVHVIPQFSGVSLANETADDADHRDCLDACQAAMVGLQLMVRVRTGDPWIWISMWWAAQDQSSLDPAVPFVNAAPWKYYVLSVSDQARIVLPDGTHNVRFNPFLEGLRPNGAVANCAQCHSYAAFDTSQTPHKPRLDGAGPNFGSPCLQGIPPGSPPCVDVAELPADGPVALNSYLSQAVQTDFLWSLANIPDLPASATPTPSTNAAARRRRTSAPRHE